VGQLGRNDVYNLRERIVPARYAGQMASVTTEPFLVAGVDIPRLALPQTYLLRQQSGGVPAAVDMPLPTVAKAGAISRVDVEPFILPRNGRCRGLHSNPAYDLTDRPLHTVIASDTRQGYLIDPYFVPFYNERATQRPRERGLDRPLPTIPASKIPGGLCAPYLIDYYGQGRPLPLSRPLPTQTSRDTFALVVPELWPLGLDIKFRMLKPAELAAAQGFPPDYSFAGTKTASFRRTLVGLKRHVTRPDEVMVCVSDEPSWG